MIGAPSGMKTLVIVERGDMREVVDLATAVQRGWLLSPHLPPDSPPKNKMLSELADAAPSLALNIKDAAAAPWAL